MRNITKRGSMYSLRLRVPQKYRSVEPRKTILMSLNTDNASEAETRAKEKKNALIAQWEALMAFDAPDAGQDAHITLARTYGFSYHTAADLAKGDLDAILARVAYLKAQGHAPGSVASKAVLGSYTPPVPTLSAVARSMHTRFPLEVRDKTRKQRAVWQTRWERPARKMGQVLGHDPRITSVTRAQALKLRDALRGCVQAGEIKGASAQKDLQNLSLMWVKYFQSLGLDTPDIPPSPFKGLADGLARLDELSRKNEVPEAVLRTLLDPGVMAQMHPDCADLIRVLMETGCRQSEITDIAPECIHLETNIPHLDIKRQTGMYARELKNKNSARCVPLVGVALEAMRRHKDGFARFRGTGTFSKEANAGLKEILPEGVTIGGLRHSFESRLKRAGVQSDDRGELMGHSVKRIRQREHYGDALPLETRLDLHQKICLTRF